MATTFDSAPAARRTNHVAVRIFGAITVCLGVAYTAFGGWLIVAGASLLAEPPTDPWKQMATFFGILPAFVIMIGLMFVPLGILGLLAGLGILLRQRWGRILTYILAGLATLLGLLWLAGSDGEPTDIALGAAQLLYGILAFVILIAKSAEFCRRPGPEQSD